MSKRALAGLALVALAVVSLQAVIPQKWELRSFEEFLNGKFDGISVSSDGWLTLAPKEDRIEGPAEEFYLSLLSATDGTLYLGTGHGGKIYKIDRNNKFELYTQVPEMDVICLAMDRKGGLYAGSSPNGKVYKISEKGKAEVFFDPRKNMSGTCSSGTTATSWSRSGRGVASTR